MDVLKFSTVLKEVPVILTGKDGVDKNCKLRELTGTQRAAYNESFDIKVEIGVDGKAKAVSGEKFKLWTATQFLALCLYCEDDTLISEKVIGGYPNTVIEKLHSVALELSGMDEKALQAAKNELKGSEVSGTELLPI